MKFGALRVPDDEYRKEKLCTDDTGRHPASLGCAEMFKTGLAGVTKKVNGTSPLLSLSLIHI